MADENEPSTQDPNSNATDEDGLMELFDPFSSFISLMSDCLELDTTIIISEACLQGKHYLPDHNSKSNNSTTRHRDRYISCLNNKYFFQNNFMT